MIKRWFSFFKNGLSRKTFQIFTDGSQKKNWGSWAFVVVQNGNVVHESWGRKKRAGSNEMEFQAALNALVYLPDKADAEIFTDSRILVNAMTKVKDSFALREQILKLSELSLNKKIRWKWVKAHSGVKYNERCDELCIQARS